MKALQRIITRQANCHHPGRYIATRSPYTVASTRTISPNKTSLLFASTSIHPFSLRSLTTEQEIIKSPQDRETFKWEGIDWDSNKVAHPIQSVIERKKREAEKNIASSLLPTTYEMEVINLNNEVVDHIKLNSEIFGCPIRRDILHQVVVWQLACRRQGTASAKTRGEVRGSTRKIRRQKGTGAARVGSIRPPHFRGGGVAFPPKPRDFSYPLPKKVQQMGLRVALSTKYAQGKLWVVDSLNLESHKSKEFQQLRKRMLWDANSLLMIAEEELQKNLTLATSNIRGVEVFSSRDLNVYAILCNDFLIMEKEVIKELEGGLNPSWQHPNRI